MLCHYLIHSLPPILFFNFAEMFSSHLLYPLHPSLSSNFFPDLFHSTSCPVNFISPLLLPHLLSWSWLQYLLSIVHNFLCAINYYELRFFFYSTFHFLSQSNHASLSLHSLLHLYQYFAINFPHCLLCLLLLCLLLQKLR